MEYLLDTQIIILSETQPDRISPVCRDILLDKSLVKYISHASIWEVSIKQKIGKLQINFPWHEYIQLQALEVIKIKLDHILETKKLPLIHRDPFDRILIAQSIVEKIPLITADKEIKKYNFDFIDG